MTPNSQPSVTAILLSYNCQDFVAEALASVLAQNYRPLDILISDDASQDHTFSILEHETAGYDGPHRIRLTRQATNSGSKQAHLNRILGSLSADIFMFFDGDDVAKPHRAQRLVEAFREDANVHAVYSAFEVVNRSGKPLGRRKVPHPDSGADTAEWFAKVDAYAAGSTLAVRSSVIRHFGVMDPAVNEDIILPFRASLLGEVQFIDEELVTFRRHIGSFTTSLERFSSVEQHRSAMEAGILMARKSAETRLADIDTAVNLMPARSKQLLALRAIVAESLTDAELTGDLVDPSILGRLLALLRLSRAGAYRGALGEHVCMALWPNMYLRYKRHRILQRVS